MCEVTLAGIENACSRTGSMPSGGIWCQGLAGLQIGTDFSSSSQDHFLTPKNCCSFRALKGFASDRVVNFKDRKVVRMEVVEKFTCCRLFRSNGKPSIT